jgi:hypothetical protein
MLEKLRIFKTTIVSFLKSKVVNIDNKNKKHTFYYGFGWY